jgi:hypothetical protein
MDDSYQDEQGDETLQCEECDLYQQQIYELNRKLRAIKGVNYQITRDLLTELVQLQLRHQRAHARFACV